MSTKQKMLDLANGFIRPFGVQLYRKGFDMESILKTIAATGGEVGSIIDLGAAQGLWSRMALKHFTRSQVIGVDPLKEREPYLQALAKADSRFDYVLAAAGADDEGTVELGVMDDLDSSTVEGHEGVMRSVPTHSVDWIVRQKALPGPFLLKFDTHGFEVPILEGATETLANTRYIVMEVYAYRPVARALLFNEMCDLLAKHGFRTFNLADPLQRPLDRSLWQMDLFFAREDDPVFADSTYSGR